MTELITQDDALDKIRDLLCRAQNAKLAVAFWGDRAVEKLQLRTAPGEVQIICNLLTGATNPNEIESLRDLLRDLPNVKLKHNSRLHAKTYWTNTAAIIGSSNVSANGLNFEEVELSGWLEANVLINDGILLKDIESWFDEIWDESDSINDEDIKRARDLWAKRRNSRAPQGRKGATLIEALRENPDDFKGRHIMLVLHLSGPLSNAATKRLEAERRAWTAGDPETLDCYEGWEFFPGTDIPTEAYTIDFYVGPRGGFREFGKLWKILNRISIRDQKTDTFITLCQRVEKIYDWTFPEADQEIVRSRIRALWQLQNERGILSLFDAKDILFKET